MGEGLNDSLRQHVDSALGTPFINPGADENVYGEPVLVVTPEWQRRSWLLEVSQTAEDNPESVISVNSDNESDGGSWTFEDGPDANLKSYELQIQNMTTVSEALKARARKAEMKLSDNDDAFKKQLRGVCFEHAESLQAQQDQWDIERAETLNIKQDHDRLTVQYRTACEQLKDQTGKINDLNSKLSEYSEVLNQAKAPDGSIYTHEQRQDMVDYLKRDAEALKEFYKNQIKTLEYQVTRKMARIEKGARESRDLQNKLQTLGTELSNEQHKCRDLEAKLKLERKSHVDMEETSKRIFEAQIQEAVRSEIPPPLSKPKPLPMPAQLDKLTHSSESKLPSPPVLSNRHPPKPPSPTVPSNRQPPKLSTISRIPTPAKAQPENQLKETPPVAAQPASSRTFSIHCDTSNWMKSQSAPVKMTDEVPVSSADIERSRPIPIPVAKEQKAAVIDNQA